MTNKEIRILKQKVKAFGDGAINETEILTQVAIQLKPLTDWAVAEIVVSLLLEEE